MSDSVSNPETATDGGSTPAATENTSRRDALEYEDWVKYVNQRPVMDPHNSGPITDREALGMLQRAARFLAGIVESSDLALKSIPQELLHHIVAEDARPEEPGQPARPRPGQSMIIVMMRLGKSAAREMKAILRMTHTHMFGTLKAIEQRMTEQMLQADDLGKKFKHLWHPNPT